MKLILKSSVALTNFKIGIIGTSIGIVDKEGMTTKSCLLRLSDGRYNEQKVTVDATNWIAYEGGDVLIPLKPRKMRFEHLSKPSNTNTKGKKNK